MVVGKVVSVVDARTAEVEVIRVLKGGYAPGQRVRMPVWTPEKKLGETFVLSDPESFLGPTYEILRLEFEEEVRWLVARPAVEDASAAIRRVQGYSHESRWAGIQYLRNADPFPAEALLAAIAALRSEDAPRPYRIRCLVDALTLQASPEAVAFLRQEVQAFLEGSGREVDGEDLPKPPSARGETLVAAVGACGETWSPMYFTSGRERPIEYGPVRDELERRLLDAWPELDVRAQADVVYALAWTGVVPVDELCSRLAPEGGSDGLALGLLGVGRRHSRVWAHEEAKAAWTPALAVARRPELIRTLRQELADLPGD